MYFIWPLSKNEVIFFGGKINLFLRYAQSFRPLGIKSGNIFEALIFFLKSLLRINNLFFNNIDFNNPKYRKGSAFLYIYKYDLRGLRCHKFFLRDGGPSYCRKKLKVDLNKITNVIEFESNQKINVPELLHPKIIDCNSINDSKYVYIELIRGFRSILPRLDLAHIEFLTQLYFASSAQVPLHDYINCCHKYHNFNLKNFLEVFPDMMAPSFIKVGISHGDFAPYNIFNSGGKLVAIDWEYAKVGYSVFFDLIYYHVSNASNFYHKMCLAELAEIIIADSFNLANSIKIYRPIALMLLYIDSFKVLAWLDEVNPNDPITFKLSELIDSNHLQIKGIYAYKATGNSC